MRGPGSLCGLRVARAFRGAGSASWPWPLPVACRGFLKAQSWTRASRRRGCRLQGPRGGRQLRNWRGRPPWYRTRCAPSPGNFFIESCTRPSRNCANVMRLRAPLGLDWRGDEGRWGRRQRLTPPPCPFGLGEHNVDVSECYQFPIHESRAVPGEFRKVEAVQRMRRCSAPASPPVGAVVQKDLVNAGAGLRQRFVHPGRPLKLRQPSRRLSRAACRLGGTAS